MDGVGVYNIREYIVGLYIWQMNDYILFLQLISLCHQQMAIVIIAAQQ